MAKIKQTTRKNAVNIWYIQIKSIPLQSISEMRSNMVAIVQQVRASDCGSECRRFESDQPPCFKKTFLSITERNVFCQSSSPSCFAISSPPKYIIRAVFTFKVSITWVLFVIFVMPKQDKRSAHVRCTEQTYSKVFKQTKTKHTRIYKLIKLSTQQPTNL